MTHFYRWCYRTTSYFSDVVLDRLFWKTQDLADFFYEKGQYNG